MSTDTCIVSILPDKIKVKIDGKSREQIRTPFKIAHEMVEVVCISIPDDKWNKDLKILDFYCKSGVFLKIFADKLFEKTRHLYNNDKECMEHILKHQLFGIAADNLSQALATRALYGGLVSNSNIKYIEHFEELVKLANPKLLYERIKETFSEVYNNIEIIDKDGNYNMKGFGVVIGNPPYNNDAYLDFVDKGHKLSSNLTCMITPAKWQAKGGEKNEAFRREIVPYMEEIIVYPDCGDVFDIRLQGGVSYYLIDKNVHEETKITNHCTRVSAFNSNGVELRKLDTDKCFINSNKLYNICKKVGCFELEFKPWKFGAVPVKDNYNVFATAVNTDAGGKTSFHIFSNSGNLTMLAPFTICKDTFFRSNDTKCFFTSNNEESAQSFISWANTKFIRFMILMRYCTYHNNNTESWAFVPDPGTFDHIFTDDELYKKYNITEEEQNIIKSIIKERK